jgi:hypothetical protein
VVDDAGLAGEPLGDREALVLGLVREHRAGDHVADRPHAVDTGAELVIDLDLPALVQFQPDPVEAETFGVRAAADRDQYAVGLEGLARAAGGGLER